LDRSEQKEGALLRFTGTDRDKSQMTAAQPGHGGRDLNLGTRENEASVFLHRQWRFVCITSWTIPWHWIK